MEYLSDDDLESPDWFDRGFKNELVMALRNLAFLEHLEGFSQSLNNLASAIDKLADALKEGGR